MKDEWLGMPDGMVWPEGRTPRNAEQDTVKGATKVKAKGFCEVISYGPAAGPLLILTPKLLRMKVCIWPTLLWVMSM